MPASNLLGCSPRCLEEIGSFVDEVVILGPLAKGVIYGLFTKGEQESVRLVEDVQMEGEALADGRTTSCLS